MSKDVGDDYFAKVELDFLVSKGIFIKDQSKSFGVHKEITRLEAAEMMVKALGLETVSQSEHIITDIPSDHINFPIVATIVERGIMKTDENGAFNPDAPFTRGESAVFLVRAFDLKGTSKTPFVDALPEYWVSEAVNILQANNIAKGYPDNTYKPLANITKSDFAIQLAHVLNANFRNEAAPVLPASCEKPTKIKTTKVNVQVTSLWHMPNINRVVYFPTISTPVDISK